MTIVLACSVVGVVVVLRNVRGRHQDRELARDFVQLHDVEAPGGYVDQGSPDTEDAPEVHLPMQFPNTY